MNNRKTILGIIILVLFLVSSSEVFAGDILWRITHNDQEALIIGEIVYEVGNSYRVEVKHVISGILPNGTISLSNDFSYIGINEKPQVGDFLVLSLDKKILNYYIKYGAFKANNGDYESLKLYKNDLPHILQAEFTVLEYYINTNGEPIDYYFEGDKVFLKNATGEDFLIFSADNVAVTTALVEDQPYNLEEIFSPTSVVDKNISFINNRVILGMVLSGVLAVIYLSFIKK
ncbi:hypothetical protein [Alkaliphilus transvaalensis]|uniref:hypothetical protein n=1 Tax=Alkaliphilus transvaalensis TaxID=114628 RepID=UPI00047A55B3|nr:hypothetical protein [Alkaliphilus transvaalensis]